MSYLPCWYSDATHSDWAGMVTGLSMVNWIKYAKQFYSKWVVRWAADAPFLDAGYVPW